MGGWRNQPLVPGSSPSQIVEAKMRKLIIVTLGATFLSIALVSFSVHAAGNRGDGSSRVSVPGTRGDFAHLPFCSLIPERGSLLYRNHLTILRICI
jgi:hypothetical protein